MTHPDETASNLYAPPQAEVHSVASEASTEFYVVSTGKFLLLYFFTVGIYQLYWFYRQWAQYRRHHGKALWPIPRAIFSVFFTHSLTRAIHDAQHKAGVRFAWSPSLLATIFVILQIASNVLDRMSWREIGSPLTDWLSLATLIPLAHVLYAIQKAANAACADPDGAGNRYLSGANWAWILLGVLCWLLILIVLVIPAQDLA